MLHSVTAQQKSESLVSYRLGRLGLSSVMPWIVLILVLIIGHPASQTNGIRWLGIYRLPRSADHPPDTTADRFTSAECHTAATELGLRRRQARFCNHPRFGYAMLAVLRAAHAVGFYCPKAFADRRWNCTSVHRLPEVSPELKRGTREQALVHAFSSAALLFEIGRYCALNKIRSCSCGDENNIDYPSTPGALVYEGGSEDNEDTASKTVNGQAVSMNDGPPTVSRFYWAGCSDNLQVAREYASAFLGFPNIRVIDLPPAETTMHRKSELDDVKLRRIRRLSERLNQVDPELEDEDEEDDSESEDQPDQPSVLLHPTQRMRRQLPQRWQYLYAGESAAQQSTPTNAQTPYRSYLYRPPHRSPSRMNSPLDYLNGRWQRRLKQRTGRRSKSRIIRVMNRHNYLAGVVLMEANHKLACKCHGVSGSCAQRVCFRQLRRIDDGVMQKALKSRYLAAKQVSLGSNKQLIAKTFTGSGFVDEVVKASELVFSEHSPDYCNKEPHRGSVGTHGRLCTLKDAGTANCLNMCCGRGYMNVTALEIEDCNCRMGEGFKVKCDECRVEKVTQRCL